MYTCSSSSSQQVAQQWYAAVKRPTVQHAVHSTCEACGLTHSPCVGLEKSDTRYMHVSVARHPLGKNLVQMEGWSARSRRDEMLGDSAKMNLQRQFEQSVAADRGGSTLQVSALCPALRSVLFESTVSTTLHAVLGCTGSSEGCALKHIYEDCSCSLMKAIIVQRQRYLS